MARDKTLSGIIDSLVLVYYMDKCKAPSALRVTYEFCLTLSVQHRIL